jgi:transcriptional regulator with XRE-family HTH domain
MCCLLVEQHADAARTQEAGLRTWDWQSLDTGTDPRHPSTMPVDAFIDPRRELADFLRGRRARLRPKSPGRRRRTPGLRREEIAQLAGLSVDWYTRLEQARDVNPSSETLDALATVLGLDTDERAHLYALARAGADRPASRPLPDEPLDAPLAGALAGFAIPSLAMNARFDVLAMNPAAERLLGVEPPGTPARNMLWSAFLHPARRARYTDLPTVEAETVAAFRASAAAHAGDPRFEALVRELHEASPRFRELWARHDVRPKVGGLKGMLTDLGPVVLTWGTLVSPTGSGQMLIYYAGHGDEDRRRLAQVTAGT